MPAQRATKETKPKKTAVKVVWSSLEEYKKSILAVTKFFGGEDNMTEKEWKTAYKELLEKVAEEDAKEASQKKRKR